MVKRFTYNDYHIDLVYQFLKNFKRQRINKEYEIRIDGLTVVERTEDLNHFYWFKKYVDEFMTRVSIVFYKGKSRKSDQYILERKIHGIQTEVFDQTAIDQAVQSQTEAFQKEMKFKLLKKKNKQLKKQLKEIQERNKTLVSKQHNGIKEMMNVLNPLINGNLSSTETQIEEIGGVPLGQLLNLVRAKQKKWGDEIFARSIGISMVIGDNPELLEKVEQLIRSNTNGNEEEE